MVVDGVVGVCFRGFVGWQNHLRNTWCFAPCSKSFKGYVALCACTKSSKGVASCALIKSSKGSHMILSHFI